MEGLAWLLIKMAALLALTGAAFLALGWWLRGRQAPVRNEGEAPAAIQAEEALRTAEAARDVAERELHAVRLQLAAAEAEIARLQAAVSAPGVAEELALKLPAEKTPKPKAARKPRARKSKT